MRSAVDLGATGEEADRCVDVRRCSPAERIRIARRSRRTRACRPTGRRSRFERACVHARLYLSVRGRARRLRRLREGTYDAWSVRPSRVVSVTSRADGPSARRRCLSARPMGRDDRNRNRNDEPGDKERGRQSEPDAAGDPTAVVVSRSPEEARTGNHERSSSRGEHEAGRCRGVHVPAGDLGRSDSCPDERPDPEHERGHGSPARACAEHGCDREPENREGDHRRDDVVAQARSCRRCRRDDDDVESDGCKGRHEDEALPRRRPAHAPRVDELHRRGSSL